jgi:hypothetical protein
MPQLKPIDPPEHHNESHHTGLVGFAERAIGFVMPRFALDSAVKKTPTEDVPRVGDFYADYSGLSPEEIAATDSECEELFKNSKPVSR